MSRAASAVLAEPLCKWFVDEAKKRQGARTDIKAKLPECSNGQARDQLGKLFGIGGRYAKALSELANEIKEISERTEPEWQQLSNEWRDKLTTLIPRLHSGEIEMAEAKREKQAFEHGKLIVETELARRKKPELVLADPPWEYDSQATPNRAIENHYPSAGLNEICSHSPLTSENCILLLWATAPKLIEALQVMKEWGFEYKTGAVWDKEKTGQGYWFRGQHEHLLVGVKGEMKPPPEVARISSVFPEKRTSHSTKPECVYKWIEHAFPQLEKLEMYARTKRDGWKSWGNQV